jgi:uncharacterized membrane protein YgaE (UPF0421/DUF939 family)
MIVLDERQQKIEKGKNIVEMLMLKHENSSIENSPQLHNPATSIKSALPSPFALKRTPYSAKRVSRQSSPADSVSTHTPTSKANAVQLFPHIQSAATVTMVNKTVYDHQQDLSMDSKVCMVTLVTLSFFANCPCC